jgi:hypothetical protein
MQEVPQLSERDIIGALQETFSKSIRADVTEDKPKSFLFNPYSFTDSLNHKQMISGLTYSVCHNMVQQSQIISAIVNTRVNQVSAFARPPRTRHSLGFRIQKKNTPKMSESEKRKAKQYEDFILNCGQGSASHKRDYFEQFLKKTVRDRLIVDQVNFERVFTRGGQLNEFVSVDSASIRIALRKFLERDKDEHAGVDTALGPDRRGIGFAKVSVPDHERAYVQVLNGQIVCEYTEKEMAFLVAWPRTEINVAGYGYSEVEQLISTITAILFASEYNRRFFSSGSSPKGVLNVKANMNQAQMDGFKKAWLAQLSGITGAWRTPIVAAEGGLEFINMQQTNREMEFSKYSDFLIKVACAVYQIAPEEINFSSSTSASGAGAVFESKSELRLKSSRDKGLVPLLTFFENSLNREVMDYLDPNYEIIFVGLDGGTAADQVELHEKELKNFKTVNEVREENELPPIEGGDIILNSVYAQLIVNERQIESQKENLEITQDFTKEQTDDAHKYEEKQMKAQMAMEAKQAPPEKEAKKKPVKKSLDKVEEPWDLDNFDNFDDFAAEVQKNIHSGGFEKALSGLKDETVKIDVNS